MNIQFFIVIFFLSGSLHASWFAHDRAAQALQQNNLSQAKTVLQELLLHDPYNATVLYDAGIVSYKTNEFQPAAAYFKKAAQSAQENNISLPKEFYQIKQYVEHLETTELEQTPTGLSTIDGIDWRTNRFLKKPSEAERNALNEWKEIMEKIASNDSFASLEGDLILLEINLMRIKSMAKADLERVNDFWNNHPTFMQSSNLHKQSSNSHQKLLFICGGTGILIVCASIIAYKIYKVIKKNQHSKNRMQAQSIAS